MTATIEELNEMPLDEYEALAKSLGKSFISIPDHTGDLRLMWDPRDKDEVKAAKEAFHKGKKQGMLGYSVGDDGEQTGEVIHEFDPSLSKIIMTKQLAGG